MVMPEEIKRVAKEYAEYATMRMILFGKNDIGTKDPVQWLSDKYGENYIINLFIGEKK